MKPRRLEVVLAKRLRELATFHDVPLSHVADRAGIARSYFWTLLDAESSATLEMVQRIAAVLQEDPIDLLIDATRHVAVHTEVTGKERERRLPNPIKRRRVTKR